MGVNLSNTTTKAHKKGPNEPRFHLEFLQSHSSMHVFGPSWTWIPCLSRKSLPILPNWLIALKKAPGKLTVLSILLFPHLTPSQRFIGLAVIPRGDAADGRRRWLTTSDLLDELPKSAFRQNRIAGPKSVEGT